MKKYALPVVLFSLGIALVLGLMFTGSKPLTEEEKKQLQINQDATRGRG